VILESQLLLKSGGHASNCHTLGRRSVSLTAEKNIKKIEIQVEAFCT